LTKSFASVLNFTPVVGSTAWMLVSAKAGNVEVTISNGLMLGAELGFLGGTVGRLETAGHPYSHLPLVQRGWKETNAFFKVEGTQVNIGLGNGNALNVFNFNIQHFKIIP